MIVLVATYQRITGDTETDPAVASARIEEAVDALEDELARPLAQSERTERMWADRAGWFWPRATPIVEAEGYTVDGHGLIGAPAHLSWTYGTGVDVTYTGGWLERTANEGPFALPACIERDICYAADALGTLPQFGQAELVGAQSVRVGDVSVTHGAGGAPPIGDRLRGVWSRQTLRYRYRRAP
jgi:hypothetical protein